ncbi:MAG: DUF3987 domain-containing protein [Bacteroidota bacterium]
MYSGITEFYNSKLQETEKRKLHDLEVAVDETDIYEEVEFPLDAFPGHIPETIRQVAAIKQTEPSHLGTGILSVAGYSVGNTFRVQLSESYDPVPLTTWMLLVENSGRGKGKANSFVLAPIKKLQGVEDVKASNAEYDIKKSIAQLKDDISNCENAEQKQLYKKQLEDEQKKKIVPKKYLTTDVTIESIRHSCKDNPRGVYIMREELAGWYNSFGKYAKGSSDEESSYIEIYDGEDIRPSRSNSVSSNVIKPFVPVYGGTQPGRLGELAKNNRMASGFIYRMLFSYPPYKKLQRMDAEKILSKDNNIAVYAEQWQKTVEKIFEIKVNYLDHACTIPDPGTIKFDEPAVFAYEEWVNDNREFANNCRFEESVKADIDSIISRLEMNMLRCCLIMQVLKWATGEGSLQYVTRDTVEATGRLMNYYRFTSLKVYTEIEKIRFELGLTRSRKVRIDYKKAFGKRKEISKADLIEKVSNAYKITKSTTEKYINQDVRSEMPPIIIKKDGRKVYYVIV